MIDTHYHADSGLYHARDLRHPHREAWDANADTAHNDYLNMDAVLEELFGYCTDTPE